MVDMRIKCPICEHQLSVEGTPGDQLYITCPKCNTYGKYTFPIDKKEFKKIDCFTSLGDKCFKRLRIFNAVMGVIHLIQGILMLVLSNNFTLPAWVLQAVLGVEFQQEPPFSYDSIIYYRKDSE